MRIVYIVSFYANIIKIAPCSLIIADLLNQGVENGYLSRVLNTIITDEIVMIKIT